MLYRFVINYPNGRCLAIFYFYLLFYYIYLLDLGPVNGHSWWVEFCLLRLLHQPVRGYLVWACRTHAPCSLVWAVPAPWKYKYIRHYLPIKLNNCLQIPLVDYVVESIKSQQLSPKLFCRWVGGVAILLFVAVSLDNIWINYTNSPLFCMH